MKKILFVANVHQHFLDCHLPYIQWLREQGHTVHVAAGEETVVPGVDRQFNLSMQRSPFRVANISTYYELKKILSENRYDLVHCHTPMGGVLARLAARKLRKKGSLKVLYTAHGFHFFRGAPWYYWLTFFPVEKWLSRYTDAIITINREDYDLVLKRHFRNRKTFIIHSMGVSRERFARPDPGEKNRLRQEMGYMPEDFILIYAAEFIPRKNHRFILELLPLLAMKIPRLKVIFAGCGPLSESIRKQALEEGFGNVVDFPGFRTDIEKWMALSDVCISSSLQEGFGMHIAECMFCGLTSVVTEDRGHREMVVEGVNGFLVPQGHHRRFAARIIHLYRFPEVRKQMGEAAYQSVQKFALENSLRSMIGIYGQFLKAEG